MNSLAKIMIGRRDPGGLAVKEENGGQIYGAVKRNDTAG